MPAKMFSISLLLCSLFVLLVPTALNAQTIYWKKDYIRDSSGSTIAVATPQPSDTTAPNVPGTPTSTTTTSTSVALTWSTSSGSPTGYVIYRGPIPVGAVSGTTFTDVGLLPYTSYSYRIVAFDASHNYSGYSSTFNVTTSANTSAPFSLTATASSTTQVNLTWSAPSSGAPHHYRILRRSGGDWSTVLTTNSTSYSDTGLSASTAYLYKVRAENSSNQPDGTPGNPELATNLDLATTVIFTDDTITVASTVIKANHVTELRTAVNALRTAAGLGSATWTNSPLSGAWIKAVDISELRTALGNAINILGLTAPNYTDSTLIGTPTNATIKKSHIEELLQRVK
jgi:chitodextrinase